MNAAAVARACCVVLFACAFTQTAAADPALRVALVRAPESDRLLREANTRLCAELSSAGFEITWITRAPGDGRAQVETAAFSRESFATVALHHNGFGAFADVRVGDHVTGKTVVRRLVVGEASNAATVLAIRALELLKASLLELSLPGAAAAPGPKPASGALVRASALPLKAAVERFLAGPRLGIGAFGLMGTRGLGLALGPRLGFSHGLGKGWFARLAVAGPLLGHEPERTEGRARLHQELATLDLGLSTDARPLGVYGWMGAGVFHLHTAGSAAPPFRAASDDVVSFASNAGVGLSMQLGQGIALNSELGVLWAVPHAVVVIAGDDVGVAGAPSLSIALGLSVGL